MLKYFSNELLQTFPGDLTHDSMNHQLFNQSINHQHLFFVKQLLMLYVISFLAPDTRISSKQNADAISKGYQFMQQFTLSLKASLASEAQALEEKFGEVLCCLLRLSPSAVLPHQAALCSWERQIWQHPAPQHRDISCLHLPCPAQAPTHPFGMSQSHCVGLNMFKQSHSSLGHYLQGRRKQTTIHLSCPRDSLELLLMGDAPSVCQCALTSPSFSSCSLQTLLRSARHNCPIYFTEKPPRTAGSSCWWDGNLTQQPFCWQGHLVFKTLTTATS